MEKNSRLLIYILAAAFALGVLVVALSPGYRRSLAAIARGRPDEAPVWRTNLEFYEEVGLPVREEVAP